MYFTLTNRIADLIRQSRTAAQLCQRPRRRKSSTFVAVQPLECRYLLSASPLSFFDSDEHDDDHDHDHDNREGEGLFAESDEDDESDFRAHEHYDDDNEDDDDDAPSSAPLVTPPVAESPGPASPVPLSGDTETSGPVSDHSNADQISDQEPATLPGVTDASEESAPAASDATAKVAEESKEENEATDNRADSAAALISSTVSENAAATPLGQGRTDVDHSGQQGLLNSAEASRTDRPTDTTEALPFDRREARLHSPKVVVEDRGSAEDLTAPLALLLLEEGPLPTPSPVAHRANYAAMIRTGNISLEPAAGLVMLPHDAASLSGSVDTAMSVTPASARLSLAVSATLLITWLGAREQQRVERRRIGAR
ncbi:MAG: hypothetical protein NXI04_27175 [Planctomycetaceae bacterium]|nr:hypothetical protein [Planctomycetaceae bacterium]